MQERGDFMKFGDKLMKLRKQNGYSQEELAEKLGVSRQSVSKWESNNTYPETDKIIQIANLFDCSMDDLINDKITDVESTLRKNKNNIYTVWDSLLGFITNTVNMFSKMKFADGLKCVIEMIILGLLLSILGNVICGITSSVIANLFGFLKPTTVSIIKDILDSIFHLIWFIIMAITIIYSFKIRYLNSYEQEVHETDYKKDEKSSIEAKDSIPKKTNIQYNEKPFAFLGTLSQIVVIFIKFIVCWMLIGTIFIIIGLVTASIISISFIPTHIMFLWITLLLISGVICSVLFAILFINFIFEKKVRLIYHIIIFISCLIVSGISIGLLILSIKNIEFIDDNRIFHLQSKEIPIEYRDDLVITSTGVGNINHYRYIIDSNMEDNKIIVSKQVDSKYFILNTHTTTEDQLPVVHVHQEAVQHVKTYYQFFIKNLKENKIYTFEDYANDPLIIRANEKTIQLLKDNLSKLYLYEEKTHDNESDIVIHSDKVYFKNGLEGIYNAIDDSIQYNEENYICTKEIEKTQYGERIIYTCNETEED